LDAWHGAIDRISVIAAGRARSAHKRFTTSRGVFVGTEAGVATYLGVIAARQSPINSKPHAPKLLGQRMPVPVSPVKVLGYTWQGAQQSAK
jgi:hypothetical protein